MANALSPLSASRQNARSPLHAGSLDYFAHESAPLSAKRNRSSADLDDDAIFDDENSVLTPKGHGTITSTPRRRQQDGSGTDDGDLYARACTAADGSPQDPPSSPFQESIHSEDTAEVRECRSNSASYGTAPEDEGTTTSSKDGDIYMVEERSEPTREELCNMDEGNDATYPGMHTYDYYQSSKVESCSSIFRHRHQTHVQSNGGSPRKVSNMTIENEGMSAVLHRESIAEGEYDTGDETCHSTFSAVPNADMTLFSKLYVDSPAKRLRDSINAKRLSRASFLRDSIRHTPGSARRYPPPVGASPIGSPTPRRKYPRIDDNLLEFTDQFDAFSQSHRVYGEDREFVSPGRRTDRLLPRRRSPAKVDLLDLDIPPAPTPRSIPTITPRELESLRSHFLSEVSSLKATLSGRDAEVASLKEAVASAERRVGEALEEVRNEAARKEALEVQQREWERRGKEMENVLRTVRTEILDGERERDRLLKKAEEAEKAKEQLEGRVVELESQLSAARESAESGSSSSALSSEQGAQSSCDTAKEVQDAVEKVARELHSLYKSKHETKVAALKKSYEARWEKRVRELENKLHKAVAESERLQNELDTMISSANVGETTMLRESEELEAQKRVLEAKVKGLEQELNAVKCDADILRSELKHERAEKSELVAVVDEWLAMQEEQAEQDTHMETERSQSPEQPTLNQENILDETAHQATGDVPDAATDESGAGDTLRAVRHVPAAPMQPPASTNVRPRVTPGLTPKVPRFGMPNGHSRTNSGGSISSGIGRLPVPGRSGIMSSIERMGRGGG